MASFSFAINGEISSFVAIVTSFPLKIYIQVHDEWVVVVVVVVCCDLEFLLARSIKANDDEAPGMK
jgi:hypothetical protein